jgi:hypothetical protein
MQIEKNLLYQRILIVAFWIRATFGFFAEEIAPPLIPGEQIVTLLFDATLVAIGLLTLHKKGDIIMLVAFVAVAGVITCLYNKLSIIFFANGLRDFITFLFVVPIMHYFFENPDRKERFVASFDKQLYIFLLIQMFCVTWQFLMYGAGDHGGGSLGNYNSGIISILIYLISYYLLNKRIDTNHFWASLWDNKIFVISLFPTFLNETKISFVFLLMFFLLLIPIDRRLFKRLLLAIPIITIITICGTIVYVDTTNNVFSGILSKEGFEDYFIGGDLSNIADLAQAEGNQEWVMNQDERPDVPRVLKLILLPELEMQNPGHTITGFGVGQFKGNTTLQASNFATEYDWFINGSVPYIFHVFIQLGVIGIIWLIIFWVQNLVIRPKGKKRNMNLQFLLILTILIILIYNEMFRDAFTGIVFFYILSSSWIEVRENESEVTVAST